LATVKLKIKKDDIVKVIAGREKGKKGKVLRVFPPDNRLMVEKINMIKRHMRPSSQTRQGGIVEREAPFNISNVMIICSKCDEAVRVSHRRLDDGKKVRVCKKCGEVLDRT